MDDEAATAAAIQRALAILRYIAANERVCVVCFCELIAGNMTEIADRFEHGDELEPMSVDDLTRQLREVGELNTISKDDFDNLVRLLTSAPAGNA